MCLQFVYHIKEWFLCEETRQSGTLSPAQSKEWNAPRLRHQEAPRTERGREELLPEHWP